MGKKILIAEDDLKIVELIKEIFKPEDIQIIAVNNGVSAITKARSEKPNLIIMDLKLPHMDGIKACMKLRQFPETKGIPIIVVSAFLNKRIIMALLHLGVKDYIIKPFDIKVLTDKINKILSTVKVTPKLSSKLKVKFVSQPPLLNINLGGELIATDKEALKEEIKGKLNDKINKIIFNVINLKIFGTEQVEVLEDVINVLKEKYIVKISAGPVNSLRAALIKNSTLKDYLLIY